MSSNKLSCGAYIAQLRKENDYTLKGLAKELGVSVSFLSDVEQGRRKPFNRTVFKALMWLLCNNDKQRYELMDLRAKYTGGLPMDVEEYILNNPSIIEQL